jgi:hypothetical protein
VQDCAHPSTETQFTIVQWATSRTSPPLEKELRKDAACFEMPEAFGSSRPPIKLSRNTFDCRCILMQDKYCTFRERRMF